MTLGGFCKILTRFCDSRQDTDPAAAQLTDVNEQRGYNLLTLEVTPDVSANPKTPR